MTVSRGRPRKGADHKILNLTSAAKELFLVRGYASTSMGDIATKAHASKTTLYSRFSSKTALFAAVIKSSNQSAGMDFDPEGLVGLSTEVALKEIASRFLALVCSPDALRLELIYHSEAAQ